MALAKVIEISSSSPNSFQDAIESGIKRAGKTVENIQGVWIKEHKVEVENNQPVQYLVDMKVTFILNE
ncbi:MAG: dodecin family protein [Candidatus Hydrogenedentota bacterium]